MFNNKVYPYKTSKHKLDLWKGNKCDLVNRFIKNLFGLSVGKSPTKGTKACTSGIKGPNPNITTCKLEEKKIKHCMMIMCIELHRNMC